MKVLHDWDQPELTEWWALKRGITLLLYWLTRKFGFLKRIKYLRENSDKIKSETLAYMETLIKLNAICEVNQIYGIRDIVKEEYGEEINALSLKYDLDVRQHIHKGENSDLNRVRIWRPPLRQTPNSWHFDVKYARGEKVVLRPGERPIFHVDRPFHLALYIDYLYGEIIKWKTQLS